MGLLFNLLLSSPTAGEERPWRRNLLGQAVPEIRELKHLQAPKSATEMCTLGISASHLSQSVCSGKIEPLVPRSFS